MRAIAAVLRFVTLRRLAVVDDINLDTSQALRNAIQEYVDPLCSLELYSVSLSSISSSTLFNDALLCFTLFCK